tara:strand:+ start:33 stop:650 length:618 start_codon:yes stop_codon:yes gene_type:complete
MKDATEIVVVADKSGSMNAVRDDAIGGFNALVADQQKEGVDEAYLTLVLFDTTYTVGDRQAIEDVQPLTEDTYQPAGGTALLDALGRSITETGTRLAALSEDERPDQVIVAVITDGEENSSREHTKAQIKKLIEHQQEKYNWKFVYLGANQDAFAEARGLGVDQRKGFVASYTSSRVGTRQAYAGASHGILRMRKEKKKSPGSVS